MKRCATVDEYIENAERWGDELRRLREIITSTPLKETIKWGAPCYTHGGKNVVGIGAFKSYVGLWFFQGALLSDPGGVLVNAQEGRTKAQRQWRFTSMQEIKPRAIKAYVREAIEKQAQGLAIKPVRAKKFEIPSDLEAALSKSKKTRAAFDALTPGRRSEYAEYIGEAKRAETRVKRLEKILPMIREGKGLNDKYRSC